MSIKRFVVYFGAAIIVQHASFAGAGPMALSGNASVSEMGAGIYQLPIDVPPGAGELEPKLQLHYNSQAANGIVGTRWAISGLSSISRCPRTIAQDGVKDGISFDTNDRFCLDGERLMVVSGTYGAANAEYRTERDTFSKIVSMGTAGTGPAWFKVWTKDGEIIEYGNTADSRIEAQGKPSVRVWAANRVSDSKGNYRTLSYSEDTANGYYYPTRIDYTGNSSAGQAPTSSVQFQYQTRTDQEVLYLAGSIVKPISRLSKIVTANGASVVSEYRLTYDQSAGTNNSRLLSITKCGGDGACLPAVSVAWAGVAATIPSTPSYSTTENFTNNLFTPARVLWLSGDVNGDGRDDLVLLTVNNQYNLLRRTWKADANSNLVLGTSTEETGFNANLFSDMQAALVDTNADGRKDLVVAWTSAVGEVGKAVWLADANGNFPATYSSKSVSADLFSPQTYSNKAFNFGDINGDGRDDIVWSWNYGGTFNRAIWLANTSGGFAVAPSSSKTAEPGNSALTGIVEHTMMGDVNGDGIPDLIIFWHEPPNVHKVVWLGNPDGTFPATASTHEIESGFSQPFNWYASPRVFLTDVNADGRMDLSWVWTWSASNAGPGRSVWVSKGNGTFGNRVSLNEETIPNFDATFCNQRVQFLSLDINGDNRSDLLLTCSYQNNLFFVSWLTKPDGTLPATYSSNTQYTGYSLTSMMNDRVFLPSDVDGDGKGDLIFAWRNNSTTLGRAVHRATAGLVDQVSSVGNGISRVDSFSYVPMTDTNIYAASGTATVYPQKNVRLPLTVVKSLSESNDIGGTMTTNYTYTGARSDINGRGFLGFELIQGTQVETGLVTRTTFRQDWPYLSLKTKVEKLSGATVLEGVNNTFSCKNPASGSACGTVTAGLRYFPYVSQQVHTRKDLNGSVMPSTTTTWQYDNYGNPTLVSSVASDGYSKVINSTYLNDTTNWFIGRQTKSTTVGTAP